LSLGGWRDLLNAMGPLAGVGPSAGIGPNAGVGPNAYNAAGIDPAISLAAVAMRNSLIRGLGGEPNQDRFPVGLAPWTHWGEGFRALALHGDALSGLRVRAETDSESAVLEMAVADPNAADSWSWKSLGRWRRPPTTYFKDQIDMVDALVPLRETRLGEIHEQAGNALGFIYNVAQLPLHRMPRTQEFIAAALAVQMTLQMQLKQALACPRPNQMQPLVTPIIGVPAHGSLPSGHAGESYLVSALLGRLMKHDKNASVVDELLQRMALRIAENRVVAGVHFPIDSVAGRLLAQVVEQHLMAAVGEEPGIIHQYHFGMQTQWDDAQAGQPREGSSPSDAYACRTEAAGWQAADLPDHKRLWALAQAEWPALVSAQGAP
jgi:hypothetical protein